MKLDPISLKLFLRVVEEGTIARAAEREHIAVTAVSKRLRDLEDILGTALLRRTNRGIKPTTAGLGLLGLARTALNSLDEIYVQMRDCADGVRGRVTIQASLSAVVQFLPREIASFLAAHPSVRVNLEDNPCSAIVKAVAESEVDLGVCLSVPDSEDLQVFPYHRDRLGVIVPDGHPLESRDSLSFADIADAYFVGMRPTGAVTLQLKKAAAELDVSLKIGAQVASYDALCLMVEAGLGVAVLPEAIAKHYAGTLRIRAVALDEPWAERQLKICVHRYDTLPVAAKLFVDHLRRKPEAHPVRPRPLQENCVGILHASVD